MANTRFVSVLLPLLCALTLSSQASAEIGVIVPGQDYVSQARPALERECTKLIVSDNGREVFITCDLKNGDLITANAVLGGPVYWITYRTPAQIERFQFVGNARETLGFEGEAQACVVSRQPAECWTRGDLTLQIPFGRDPSGRWVAVHEDLTLDP